MEVIEKIKQQVSIIDLAEKIGFELKGGGDTVSARVNKIRGEKSCSIKFYRDSNSWHDFGSGQGGSVIDLYMSAYNVSLSEAIKKLSEENGIENLKPTEIKTAPIPQQDYMKAEIVRKIFNQQVELNFKDKVHKKLLDTIAPKLVFKQARSEDIQLFTEIVRKDKHSDTLAVLLHDEHRVEKTMRYRNKIVGEDMKKWVALAGTQSSVLYTHLTENPLTFVVEGTHDYLTSILLGVSVIALPSASYKGLIGHELTKERTLVFIGDDNKAGEDCINRLMQETVCDKKRFSYEDFREKYNLKGEDFSDLVFNYKDMTKFKADLIDYVGSLDNQKENDWLNVLRNKNNSVTRQIIKDTENMKMLIDGMLPHKQITTLVGQPNVGKSALTFAIINKLFQDKKIDNVIYFDADNPLVYTKDRILKLMDMNGDENIAYYTGSTASKEAMKEDLELLTNFRDSGDKTLIVIDSLKNFITGSINDDKSINPMFDLLQQVRDVFGATIITLHHTRKGKDEDGELNYVGSQVIEASSDNLTYISNINDVLLLKNSKARALLEEKIAVDLDFDNMVFKETDIPEEEESDGVALIVEVLEAQGYIDKKELKNFLKGKVSANDIEKTIKEHKNTMFKYKKDGDIWLVGLVAMEEPKYKAGVETEYVEDSSDVLAMEASNLF